MRTRLTRSPTFTRTSCFSQQCGSTLSHPSISCADLRFGIILWELVAMKVPYSDEKFRTDVLGLAQLYCHVVEEGKRPKVLLSGLLPYRTHPCASSDTRRLSTKAGTAH
jgi:hypothetical protein